MFRRVGQALLLGLGASCSREPLTSPRPAAPIVIAIPPPSGKVASEPPLPPPTASASATLTWSFGPILSDSEAGPQRAIVILFAASGNVRRFVLGRRQGVLVPSDQSVCLPPSAKKGDVVSFVELNTMGETHLVARRVAPELIEVTFDVDADDEPAKLHGVLARIPVPAGLPIVDQVRVVREDGSVGPLDCTARSAQ